MTDMTFDGIGDLDLPQAEASRANPGAAASPLLKVAAPALAEPSHAAEEATVAPSPRETVRIPRISIHAFCESPEVAASVEAAASDRLMTRAQMTVQLGGIAAAADFYRDAPTPNLIIVESRSDEAAFLAGLDRMAEVCDAGTRVVALGYTNDIGFYRELMRRGISDYLLAPIDPVSLIAAIASVYGEATSGKLGQAYAFIGARGGVGSSTLAHNIAWSIGRRLSLDVIVADMDLPFGTAGLDFNVDAGVGIAEAVQDTGRLDEVLLDRLLTKCGPHLSLLAAPAVLDQVYDLSEGAVERLLEVAQASVPFLVLDLPHLWSGWSKEALRAADEVVITATPDLASLRNTKNLVEMLKRARPNDPLPKVVLNQVGMPKRPEIKPEEFAKALQMQPAACISFDAHLFGSASNNGQMIGEASARSAAAKTFSDLAAAITGRQTAKGGAKSAFDLRSLLGRLKR